MTADRDLAELHQYVTEPGGKPMISVTRIARLLDDGKTDALMKWAVRLAHQGEDHEKVRDELGDLGTRVHADLHAWARGEDAFPLDDEQPYLDAAERWKEDFRPVNVYHETVVLSDLGYGGRFDSVELIGEELWGCDWKTGNPRDRENELQHAGYWHADWVAKYDEAGMLAERLPMPKVDRWACLYLHENGGYDWIEYPKRRRGQKGLPIAVLQDEAWVAFQHLFFAYLWLHPSKGPQDA